MLVTIKSEQILSVRKWTINCFPQRIYVEIFRYLMFRFLADRKTLWEILFICIFNYHREMLDDSGPTFKTEKTPS